MRMIWLVPAALAVAPLLVAPALAQDAGAAVPPPVILNLPPEKISAEQRDAEIWAKSRAFVHGEDRRSGCRAASDPNTIVICGESDDKYRVAPSPARRRADEPPQARDIPGVRSPFEAVGGVTIRSCFLQKCPEPPAIETDYSKYPVVDLEYLEAARVAEEEERRRQAALSEGEGDAAKQDEAGAAALPE